MDHTTIRTDNSPAGIAAIQKLWDDVMTGAVPLLAQASPGQFPIARYSQYESDANGAYDLTILLTDTEHIVQLEAEAAKGIYRRYEVTGQDVATCTTEAWQQVWDDERQGTLQRAYTQDFEVSIPAEHNPDGVAKCVLYIAQ